MRASDITLLLLVGTGVILALLVSRMIGRYRTGARRPVKRGNRDGGGDSHDASNGDGGGNGG